MSLTELDKIPAAMYGEILSMNGATIYHTSAWHRLLARAYGWRVRAFVSYDDEGKLRWLLPFVRKRRLGLKRINMCLPLSHRVGPVWRNDAGVPISLHTAHNPLEIHEQVDVPGFCHTTQRTVTILDLSKHASCEALKKSFHKTAIQQMIRKAHKSGRFTLVKGTTREHFQAMEQLEVETRQRQGSPTYPAGYFSTMWEELGSDHLHLHLAFLGDRPVSGILFIHFRKTAIYGYGASVDDRDVWRLGANQLTMWSAVREAFDMGLARIDFGTTPIGQPDLRTYKERWGAESSELTYTYSTEKAGRSHVNRSGMKVRAVSWVLRQLPRPVFVQVSRFLLRAVV